MINKRLIPVFLALIWFASSAIAAQPFKIAVVVSKDLSQFDAAVEGFETKMKTSGIPYKIAEFDLDEQGNKKVADAIKGFSANLIVPVGSSATRFAQEYFTHLPIVFAMVLYPTLSGLVSAAGGNITGAAMDIPFSLQFQTIQEVLPRARKIGVLYDPNETGSVIEEARKISASLSLELVAIPVRSAKEVPQALEGIERKIDVLWAVADGTVFAPKMSEYILTYTLQHNTPFMGLSPAFVEAGAPFALSQDFADIGRQAAEIVIRIFGGAKPADVQIAAARKVQLYLNVRAAEEIGIKIPDKALGKAAKVIR